MKFDKKTYTFLGIGLGLILLLYLVSILLSAEKRVDFQENFEGDKKNPYGTYLLKNSLADLFQVDSLIVQDDPLFDLMALQQHKNISYIIINNRFPVTEEDVEELRLFIEQGNHVFLSARSLSSSLSTDLDLTQNLYEEYTPDTISVFFNEGNKLGYTFPSSGMAYLSPHTGEYTVLAEDEASRAVLIKYNLGKGSLIISSTPKIFSNYYMVQADKRGFISSALTYLPRDGEIWWDEFYKRNKLRFRNLDGGGGEDNSHGTMDYIFSEEGLAWAFWLSILALLVYAIFESKRKQRIIPIIEPLPNLTLDFTETVGRLYFRSAANREVAEKRIRALLAHIRERYFMKTDKLDDKFLKSLAAKSNIPKADIKIMFRIIERIRKSEEISESQLIEINHYIDVFYKLGAR